MVRLPPLTHKRLHNATLQVTGLLMALPLWRLAPLPPSSNGGADVRVLFHPRVLLFLGSLVTGCDSSEADTPAGVFLRLENASSSDFSTVLIRFPAR